VIQGIPDFRHYGPGKPLITNRRQTVTNLATLAYTEVIAISTGILVLLIMAIVTFSFTGDFLLMSLVRLFFCGLGGFLLSILVMEGVGSLTGQYTGYVIGIPTGGIAWVVYQLLGQILSTLWYPAQSRGRTGGRKAKREIWVGSRLLDLP